MRDEKWSEGCHMDDESLDGNIIFEWVLKERGGKVWTGCIRLRIGTSGRLL
jgi:hypothetical protein